MASLLKLAAYSSWNRRFALSLIVLSVALSTFLLTGIARIRDDVHRNFAQSVSGADLIAGPRTGAVQLLLYSVFRVGGATNDIQWRSVQAIEHNPLVAWVVPISLGDTLRGFPVVATSLAYFDHFRYGDHESLALAQGKRFDGLFDAVLGEEVARRLGYRLGDRIVLSHGDGELEEGSHADKPFTVAGILRATGTPVDRSVHISMQAMEALHVDWRGGVHLPTGPTASEMSRYDLTPKDATAVLVGLKDRAAVFKVQRAIADYRGEPLMAILPGVALDELWDVVGVGERALMAVSALVAVASLAGLIATILAGLNERRRELAILRAVGAAPRHVLLMLMTEGALVTLCGVALGMVAVTAAVALLGDWFETRTGIALQARAPSSVEWLLLAGVTAAGLLASLAPAYRAYRLSLADGLQPRT